MDKEAGQQPAFFLSRPAFPRHRPHFADWLDLVGSQLIAGHGDDDLGREIF